MANLLVASPASLSFSPHTSVPRPTDLIQDDPSAADSARQRFATKRRLLSLPSLRSRSSTKSFRNGHNKPTHVEEHAEHFSTPEIHVSQDANPINLDDSTLLQFHEDHDHYEWAVVYENQRGMTIFSTPYYSSLSLLPSDPSPFTLPNASKKRSEQPPISLESYPLPDGNWRWVSRCWMIDMRSDSGEVQHDGFEYNWMFRRHHWRSDVGAFSSGGWVRRRRWVRLMVRPAKARKAHEGSEGSSITASGSLLPIDKARCRQSAGSFPPSVLTGSTDLTDQWDDMNPDDVWLGDDPEADWQRCHRLMKRFGRDGRKLEVWRLWLGYYHPEHKDKFTELDDKGKRHEKQWTEDEGPLPSEAIALDVLSKETVAMAPKECVIPALRKHGQTLLHSFIYPESRAQFLKLLGLASLLPELDIPLGRNLGSAEVDFWSYASGLGEQLGISECTDEIPKVLPVLKVSVLEAEKGGKQAEQVFGYQSKTVDVD